MVANSCARRDKGRKLTRRWRQRDTTDARERARASARARAHTDRDDKFSNNDVRVVLESSPGAPLNERTDARAAIVVLVACIIYRLENKGKYEKFFL